MKILTPDLTRWHYHRGPDGTYVQESQYGFGTMSIIASPNYDGELIATVIYQGVPVLIVEPGDNGEDYLPEYTEVHLQIAQAFFAADVGELQHEVEGSDVMLEEYVLQHGLAAAWDSEYVVGEGRSFCDFVTDIQLALDEAIADEMGI